MSTAIEAETAARLGLEVVGISCITNKAAGLSTGVLNHEEVQVTGAAAARRVGDLIQHILSISQPSVSDGGASFVGYVGDADFHDGVVLSLELHDRQACVRIRGGYSDKEYQVVFDGVRKVLSHQPEGMMLYAMSEFRTTEGRLFVFANWDEENPSRLEIEADHMTLR
jgi:hypothetical protein